MRRITIILTTLLVVNVLNVFGQRIVVEAPSDVEAGEPFRVEYTINSQNVKGMISLVDIDDDVEIVFGPSISQQESYSVVNGHASSKSSITYSYMMTVGKSGSVRLPKAILNVGNHKIASQNTTINVHGQNVRKAQSAKQRNQNISSKDLFIKVYANKSSVYEQEPVIVTYKVYTLVDLTQLEGRMPEMNGFHSQEVVLPQQKTFHTEKVNGINYRCVTWSQYVVYPQTTGKLTIPSIIFNGIVVEKNAHIDPIDAFLNGGTGYVETKRQIKAPSITLDVKQLPNRPSDFSGAVGNFKVRSSVVDDKLSVGQSTTLSISIAGTGNLKLISEPRLSLPKELDSYSISTIDRTKLTSNGNEGEVVFQYVITPRNEGTIVIPRTRFVYFDLVTRQYKAVETNQIRLNVSRGHNANGNNAIDSSSDLNDDIIGINTDVESLEMTNKDKMFFLSANYFIIVAAIVLIFLLLYKHFVSKRKEDDNKLRMTKAMKKSMLSLNLVEKRKGEITDEEIIVELSEIINKYVVERFGIESMSLSSNEMAEILESKNVNKENTRELTDIYKQCEAIRYGGTALSFSRTELLDGVKQAIVGIEEQLSSRSSHPIKIANVLLFYLLMQSVFVSANNVDLKKEADAEYINGSYKTSSELYEKLLKSGSNYLVYYNLGNSYYKQGLIGKAIVNWERSLILQPDNDEAKQNLQFVRTKHNIPVLHTNKMFFVGWFEDLLNTMNADCWAWLSLLLLTFALFSVIAFKFVIKGHFSKCYKLTLSLLVLALFITLIGSFYQYSKIKKHSTAFVIKQNSALKDMPSEESNQLHTLREGEKLKIIDIGISGWTKVSVSSKQTGWIKNDDIELL